MIPKGGQNERLAFILEILYKIRLEGERRMCPNGASFWETRRTMRGNRRASLSDGTSSLWRANGNPKEKKNKFQFFDLHLKHPEWAIGENPGVRFSPRNLGRRSVLRPPSCPALTGDVTVLERSRFSTGPLIEATAAITMTLFAKRSVLGSRPLWLQSRTSDGDVGCDLEI